jgi:4-diphosphocytidyl-2-C-methyl-D-erythritol kinase
LNARAVEVAAPGKINLILRVLQKRPDHYHNLWSIVQAIELSDTIVVEESRMPGIQLACDGAELPQGPGNLVYRAADLALERSGRRAGVRITLQKRLPIAAGVGGGSSDAAATIRALAILFDTRWSVNEMAELGQKIGSDVPFFFYGPTALVEGRGERVTPFSVDGEGWLLLVNPGIEISTAWAYRKLAEARSAAGVSAELLPPLTVSSQSKLKWSDLVPLIQNDFGPVMESVYPLLRDIRLLLLACGAQAAVLSGSGSTLAAVFPSEVEAKRASDELARGTDWKVWVTRPARPLSHN